MSNLRDFSEETTYDVVDGIKLDGTGGYALSKAGEFDVNKWVVSIPHTKKVISANLISRASMNHDDYYHEQYVGLYDGTDPIIIEHGGYNFNAVGDVKTIKTTNKYNINTDKWTRLADGPTDRGGGAAVHYSDGTNDYMVIYGGYTISGDDAITYINDTWEYNITTDTWRQLADGPSGRAYSSVIHYNDGTNDYMVIYGGGGASSDVSETWVYNITNNAWSQLADGPGARHGSATVHYSDGTNDYMIVYGGSIWITHTTLKDTWRYNITNNTWSQLTDGPTPREFSKATYFTKDSKKYILYFSGYETIGYFNGDYRYNHKESYPVLVYDIDTNKWSELPELLRTVVYAPSSRYTKDGEEYMFFSTPKRLNMNFTMFSYNISKAFEIKDMKVILPKRI